MECRHGVRVCREREAGVEVAESLTDHGGVLARTQQQQRRVRMPKLVQLDRWQSSRLR
jgi:hypothetical protein